ncbi:Leucine-rich repeat transmembrane protein kinase protein [Raphanus sativus]|uniref:non-specific serine/threonine protein kinase n=1 Tax=Raphanus sativus TaxID=3726 RepID=A0A6J0JQQ3_RAPSA|nr:senescence-induced receptor-like serine/threonine-protein kinase [Raphanus sativus]KAJ4890979.1 Leucine-rich repeat transmembrane protein kinase protein [Raphanus sativus]
MTILSSLSGISFLLLLFLVHAQDQSGFFSIDCGIPDGSSYNDETTDIKYVSDSTFVESGTSKSIAPELKTNTSLARQFQNLRSFPEGKRNCYKVWPQPGKGFKYLIRTRFMYGNYDGLGKAPPTFDLYLGVNLWDSIVLGNSTTIVTKEIIHTPSLDYFHVCLVDKNSGTPFLSVLEVRFLKNDTYETPYEALMLYKRLDLGSISFLPVRYKDDVYDRIWMPSRFENNMILNTSLPIDQNYNNLFQPAGVVMSTATTPLNANEYILLYWEPADPRLKFYVYLHFAEVEVLTTNQTREFTIYYNNDTTLAEKFRPSYLYTDTVFTPDPVTGLIHAFSLVQTSVEMLLPIVNAMEIYQVNEFVQLSTDQEDVDAMTKIKDDYRVKKNWQGDPCVPVDYSWEGLDCISSDNITNPRVISLNLSFSGLTGQIDPAFSNLTSIKKLDLSGNNLTGEVPDFLANLPNLIDLNLEGNQLTGIIPHKLLERSKDGSLSLRYGGNPELCSLDSCVKTKKNHGYIIPVVASLIVLLLLLTALALFLHFKKRSHKGTNDARTRQLNTAQRCFKYSEVVSITNNFERVLGKGGFGEVYHGRLSDGDQVAVKKLSEESAQGYKEFRAEVEILMRVHHTNLTSLIGYCNEGNSMVLIYEYMANGNLGDYLSGKMPSILSWEERLKISVDAAQGLEYLHYGCKPPIVHRDVKPTNILLNEKMQAKIADFGLSRSFPVEGSSQISTVVAGTIGYLDPEYYSTRQMNEKSDVYSFGVVLLEVITGQPAISSSRREKRHISDQVSSMLAKGNIKGIVDQRLGERYDAGSAWKMAELALACTEQRSTHRPTMSQIVMGLKQIVDGKVHDHNNQGDSTKMVTVNLDSEMVPQAR